MKKIKKPNKLKTTLLVLFITSIAFGQEKILDGELFNHFFKSTDKSLLIIGENHSSSVASTIYPEIIKYHNQKNGLNTLLIEFGPSEAYFYSQYLKTGKENLLNYTIYAGYYKDWRKAWKEIYQYNKTLKEPLQIVGIDFDRTRTFAYALYNIFKQYDMPKKIDSLMNVIKQEKFYKTYSNGYPTYAGKKFVADMEDILIGNISILVNVLNEDDLSVIKQMLQNNATGFGGNRENDIKNNTVTFINNSNETEFLLLIGRDHAYKNAIYDEKNRLATYLKLEPSFKTLTGVILHENSQQWAGNYEEVVTLFETKKKIPWNTYYKTINNKAKGDFTVIPLVGELSPLSYYTDYILIARNQDPIAF